MDRSWNARVAVFEGLQAAAAMTAFGASSHGPATRREDFARVLKIKVTCDLLLSPLESMQLLAAVRVLSTSIGISTSIRGPSRAADMLGVLWPRQRVYPDPSRAQFKTGGAMGPPSRGHSQT